MSDAPPELAAAVTRIIADGRQEFADFDDRAQALVDIAGVRTPAIREALARLPDAHRVIAHLADDLDALERLAALPPVAMAAEMGRLSGRPAAPPAPKAAPASARPRARNVADPKLSMAEYVKLRDAEHRAHLARKRFR